MTPAEAWAPACMDADDLREWSEFNRRLAAAGNRADRPCSDCLPEFAAEMRGEGRCNGTPMGHVKEKEPPMPEPTVSCDHYVKGKAKVAIGGALVQPDAPTPGRKLNLSDEERERRRQQAIAMSAARRDKAAS